MHAGAHNTGTPAAAGTAASAPPAAAAAHSSPPSANPTPPPHGQQPPQQPPPSGGQWANPGNPSQPVQGVPVRCALSLRAALHGTCARSHHISSGTRLLAAAVMGSKQYVQIRRGPAQQPQPQHVIIGYMLVTPQDSCSCDLRLEGWLVRSLLQASHVARECAVTIHLKLASGPGRTLPEAHDSAKLCIQPRCGVTHSAVPAAGRHRVASNPTMLCMDPLHDPGLLPGDARADAGSFFFFFFFPPS